MYKYIVEFIGTLLFVYVMLATNSYLAMGAITALTVLIAGPISCGSFNPAASLAMYHNGALSRNDLILYSVVQFLGGFAGFVIFDKFSK